MTRDSQKQSEIIIPTKLMDHPVTIYLAKLSPGSWRSTISVLNRMAGILDYPDCWSCPWQTIRFNQVLALRATLVVRGFAPETIKRMRAALLGTLKAAVQLKLMSKSDLDEIDFPLASGSREPRPSKRELTRSEVLKMMRVCRADTNSWQGMRDLAMIVLMLGNGVRRAGVAAAKLQHYKRDRAELVVMGKGGKVYQTHLESSVVLVLDTWLEVRGSKPGPLFTAPARKGRSKRDELDHLTPEAIYKMVLRRAAEAGLKHITPHTFRYTCATRLLKGGVAEVLIQRVLAHTSIKTTQKYFCIEDEYANGVVDSVPIPLPPEFVRAQKAKGENSKGQPKNGVLSKLDPGSVRHLERRRELLKRLRSKTG